MAEAIDWRHVDPARAAKRLVRALRRGALVGLPDECGPLTLASALSPEAARRLGPAEVLVASLSRARDWLPTLASRDRRLGERVWPGPVVLAGDAGTLSSRLPPESREALGTPLRLRLASGEATRLVAELSREPLLCTAAEVPADVRVTGARPTEGPATVIRLTAEGWSVAEEGAVSPDELTRWLAKRLLFVCTGNTCRSPMAEALGRMLLAKRLGCAEGDLPARGWVVASAGVFAAEGSEATPEAADAVAALGANLDGHESRPLRADAAAGADYLVTMTRAHEAAVRSRFGVRSRLLCPEGEDVDDPIGQSPEVYAACAKRVAALVAALLDEIAA